LRRNPTAPRRFFGDAHWNEPRKWDRKAERADKRARVFCGSMCDWAEDRPELIPHRVRLFELIRSTPNLDWLLLTKRSARLPLVLPWYVDGKLAANPWRNVWAGVTAEDTEHMMDRVRDLRAIDAAVRFVSCEPVLELIGSDILDRALGPGNGIGPVHWLIVGDESGRNARPANVEWVRLIRDACIRHDVAFHFKQWAGAKIPRGIENPYGDDRRNRKIHLPVLDRVRWDQFPR
jgi:protein gp37